jgi:alanine racemase
MQPHHGAQRSEITIDRAALRLNVRRLRDALSGAALWAVVKADAYGHGADTVAATALEEGAEALCVATIGEDRRPQPVVPAPAPRRP